MTAGLPLIENVLTPLAKSVLITLELSSETDEAKFTNNVQHH